VQFGGVLDALPFEDDADGMLMYRFYQGVRESAFRR
jgi:hypothetical protein